MLLLNASKIQRLGKKNGVISELVTCRIYVKQYLTTSAQNVRERPKDR